MKTSKIIRVLMSVVLAFCCAAGGAWAQEVESMFDYLTREENNRLTLEVDITNLLENRKTPDYIKGVLSLENGKTFEVDVRSRGKYRRKVCEIPPLKLKFSKKMLRNEGFVDSLNEIKLVIPCKDNNEGDELIAREYVAYRMFEMLSPMSVRARLVKITLKDNHTSRGKKQMLGMLVEHPEQTEARLNGSEIEIFGISPDSLEMNQAALVAIFQYMIGNTDWDISMFRNVCLIKSHETGKVIVVPYDFDFSGLVSAPYSSPSSDSGLRTVRDRFLMANGLDREALKRAVHMIKTTKTELMALCRNEYLSRGSTNFMTGYLETFFETVKDRDDVPGTMHIPIE